MKVADFWDAALRAVMGVIIFRPGISQVSCQSDQDSIDSVTDHENQAELRWRLRSVYDRQEVNEILHHLYREGFVRQRFLDNLSEEREDGIDTPPNDAEEGKVLLFSSPDRHWYQV